MVDVRKEVQELIAEIKGTHHPCEGWPARAHHIVREAADLVAVAVAAVDQENRAEDVARLEKELREILEAVIQRSNLGPAIRRSAIAVLPWVTPQLVQAAMEQGEALPVWLEANIVPALNELATTVVVVRDAIQGHTQKA